MNDDGSDLTWLTDDDADDRQPDWGTNTSTPGDDNGDDDVKNKHDSKKKHHHDNAKKKHYLLLYVRKRTASKLSWGRGFKSSHPVHFLSVMELWHYLELDSNNCRTNSPVVFTSVIQLHLIPNFWWVFSTASLLGASTMQKALFSSLL